MEHENKKTGTGLPHEKEFLSSRSHLFNILLPKTEKEYKNAKCEFEIFNRLRGIHRLTCFGEANLLGDDFIEILVDC